MGNTQLSFDQRFSFVHPSEEHVAEGDRPEAAMTRLGTHLPRTPFSLDLVGRLYRFRWQIDRCFKEWKSYANLHQFDTANAHIAEGLIWASQCAAVLKRFLAHAAQRVGGTAMSTRRVAMCAHHIVDALVAALLLGIAAPAASGPGLTEAA